MMLNELQLGISQVYRLPDRWLFSHNFLAEKRYQGFRIWQADLTVLEVRLRDKLIEIEFPEPNRHWWRRLPALKPTPERKGQLKPVNVVVPASFVAKVSDRIKLAQDLSNRLKGNKLAGVRGVPAILAPRQSNQLAATHLKVSYRRPAKAGSSCEDGIKDPLFELCLSELTHLNQYVSRDVALVQQKVIMSARSIFSIELNSLSTQRIMGSLSEDSDQVRRLYELLQWSELYDLSGYGRDLSQHYGAGLALVDNFRYYNQMENEYLSRLEANQADGAKALKPGLTAGERRTERIKGLTLNAAKDWRNWFSLPCSDRPANENVIRTVDNLLEKVNIHPDELFFLKMLPLPEPVTSTEQLFLLIEYATQTRRRELLFPDQNSYSDYLNPADPHFWSFLNTDLPDIRVAAGLVSHHLGLYPPLNLKYRSHRRLLVMTLLRERSETSGSLTSIAQRLFLKPAPAIVPTVAEEPLPEIKGLVALDTIEKIYGVQELSLEEVAGEVGDCLAYHHRLFRYTPSQGSAVIKISGPGRIHLIKNRHPAETYDSYQQLFTVFTRLGEWSEQLNEIDPY